MAPEKSVGHQLLYETVGIQIKIISNHYEESPGFEGAVNTYQEIVFQIKEEEPDDWAIGILFTLLPDVFLICCPKRCFGNALCPRRRLEHGIFC